MSESIACLPSLTAGPLPRNLNEAHGITILIVTHEDNVAACARLTVSVRNGLIPINALRHR